MSNINPVTEASVEATPLPPQPAVTNPVGTAAPILPVEDKPLNLGGHEFQSRFILGSGRYDLNLIKATVEHAGTQIVTMALRRAQTTENSVLDYIPEGITLLPNTSGARNAEEAVRIARLAREVCHTDFVKVEIEHETKYLLPEPPKCWLRKASWSCPTCSRTRLRPVSWRRPVPLPLCRSVR